MKASNVSLFWRGGIVALAVVVIGMVFGYENATFHPFQPGPRGCDLRLRYREICCAHEGTNPFHVFSREVRSEGYRSILEPTIPGEVDTRLSVHAYPPWSYTYCWFYGWFSGYKGLLILILSLHLVAAAVFVAAFLRYTAQWSPMERMICGAILIYGLAAPFLEGFLAANYGPLFAALTLALYWALERRREVLAGCLWALIMIKPQIGLLLFWPLLWSRHWKTIAVAIGVTLLATLWPAWQFGESPLALLLQVPQIGLPFVDASFLSPIGVFIRLVGPSGKLIWMAGAFLVCGALSWLVRDAPRAWMRFVPCMAFLPIWNYSQVHDSALAWNLYLALATALLWPHTFGIPPAWHRGLLWLVPVLIADKALWFLMRWLCRLGLPSIHVYLAAHYLLMGVAWCAFCFIVYRWSRRAASSPPKAQ